MEMASRVVLRIDVHFEILPVIVSVAYYVYGIDCFRKQSRADAEQMCDWR